MALGIYPVVLQLVRRLSPYLPISGRAVRRSAISSSARSSAFRSISQRVRTVGARTGRHAINQQPLGAGSPGLFRDGRSTGLARAARAGAWRVVPAGHWHARTPLRTTAL